MKKLVYYDLASSYQLVDTGSGAEPWTLEDDSCDSVFRHLLLKDKISSIRKNCIDIPDQQSSVMKYNYIETQ